MAFVSGFLGFMLRGRLRFLLAIHSAGMPRAVKRAGELKRPQRRAGLENGTVEAVDGADWLYGKWD